jgi:fibronectin-binding autotransporter adhesin
MKINKQTNTRPLHTKLKPLYAAMLPLMLSGVVNHAQAASCAAGAITIASGSGGCDVDGVNAVTTVQFQTGVSSPLGFGGDELLLKGVSPSGAVTNQTDGEGKVTIDVSTTVNSQNSFGVAGTGDLAVIKVFNNAIFNLGHDAAATDVRVVATGTLNQSAGTITTTELQVGNTGVSAATFTQSGTGVVNATNIDIAAISQLTLLNQGSGTINGLATNNGSLIFAGNYDTDSAIGGSRRLRTITVKDGVTLTLDQNASATTFNIGEGASGIVNHSAGTLTSTNLNINNGATHNLSGTASINSTNIAIGTGSSLNVNQAGNTSIASIITGAGVITKAGTGTLTLTGNNTYSGATTVSAGTLQIGNGGTSGSLGTGNVTNNSALIFNRSDDSSYAGVISGTGSLTKQGAGKLTLTNNNTYSGTTTISAGTLEVGGTNGTFGSGNLVNNGAFIYNRTSGGLTYAGNISGTGSLTKQGTTVLSLTGNNTYSGGTTVSTGQLRVTTSSLPGDVTNNATLQFNQNTNGTFAGVISGSGTLSKTGTGSVTLSGNNTYTGNTLIIAGILQASNTSALGNNSAISVGSSGTLDLTTDLTIGSLASSGNVTLNANTLTAGGNNTSTTFSGVLSGTGGLTKQGSGILYLTGTNTYTGTTTLNAGGLSLNSANAIADTGAVIINGGTLRITTNPETIGSLSGTSGTVQLLQALTVGDASNTSFGGNITGTQSFIKQGTGTLTLSSANSYSGATTVNAGTLVVNGSIASSTTTVNSGGTLGGTGTVGNVTINSGGTFAPGNSIGTTNVTGNVVFAAGSNYNVEVNAAGATDLINATGTATLTGATVNVQPEAGNYNVSTDYTILTAAGGLGGTTFSSVNSSLAFLIPTLTYDANNVFLNLARNSVSYSSIANTPNQLAVSTILSNNTTALKTINNNVLVLTNSGAQQAFDSLSGVQHTQGSVVINKLTQQFNQLLFNHSSQSANGSLAFNSFNPMQGHLVADNTNNWQTVDTDTSSLVSERGWWMQGFGSFGSIDDTTNASGADYQSGGFAFGVDADWRDFIAGVAGSYTHSNVDPFAGDSDIDSFQAGAYASWERNDIYMNASLGLGLHKVDATRTVTVGTSVNTASADYDSVTVSSAVEVGKDIPLNLTTTLTPYVGINYSHNNRDSFTETGAGSANLSVNEQDDDSLRTTIGLRLSKDIKTKHNKTITPSAMIAYVREHMDSVSRLEAGFSAVPTSTFRIDGSELDRDRLQVGAGISGQLNENTTLNVGYNGEWAGSDDHHSFAATVNFVW